MRVLVTGATGFIGANLCAELVAAGHDVAVLARNIDHWRLSALRDRLTVIAGDLGDIAAWQPRLAAFAPEAVAHLAWAGVGGGDRNDAGQVANISWTADLMTAAAAAGARVFLAAGSQAEYGPKTGIITTAAETEPTTLYGEVKLAACRIGAKIARQHGMRFVWTRVFSTYGAGDHPRWMIPGLIGKLLSGEPAPLTRGEQLWDFLHVRDAARAMELCLRDPAAEGIYNLGSGEAPSLRHTIEIIHQLVDPAAPLGWGDVPYRDDQVMHLQADVTPLRRLGWRPRVPFAEGASDTVAWYRANPWVYEEGRTA